MGRSAKDRPQETMESYLTVVEAARYLSRCTKTVKSYVQHGVLRARRFRGHGRRLWLYQEDVQALKEMCGRKLRTVDFWDLLQTVKVRLKGIEKKLDFLMKVNGLDVSLLRDVDVSVLVSVYDEVCAFLELNAHDVPYDQMEEWAKVFLQFTELEYEQLVGPSQDLQPWKPFHVLCKHLMHTLRRKKGFSSHYRMQQSYRLLDKARKHIVQSALVFEESRAPEIGPRRVTQLADLSSSEDTLDRYIAAEAHKSHIH